MLLFILDSNWSHRNRRAYPERGRARIRFAYRRHPVRVLRADANQGADQARKALKCAVNPQNEGWLRYPLGPVVPKETLLSTYPDFGSMCGDLFCGNTCCVPTDEWDGTYDKMKKWANESRIPQWVLDKAAAAGD